MARRAIIAAALLLWTGAAAAAGANLPLYAPPPDWVRPLPIPQIAPGNDGSPIQVLLRDNQTRLGPDGDAAYSETALRILSPQGLAAVGNLSQVWSPDTESLTFHHLNILRGDTTIDLLAGGKGVTVLRRETGLELAALDGRLTATVQPEGLRVGDIIDLAVTVTRHDPALQGRSETLEGEHYAGVAGRIHIRALWPRAKHMRWRATEGLPAPTLSRTAQGAELVVDATNIAAPIPPADAPPRFNDLGELELSEFQTWSEVSALMAPLYQKAASLGPASPLRQEIERIGRAHADPKGRAEAALRLAQDQIHYVFLGLNFGGYVPADAEVTWSRRFGDCKGKTALLLALLHGLGVEAEPALVSTGFGDGLDERLPMLGLFDHVFVRARIGGKVYWLDGTRVGDRDLDDIPVPNVQWVLPVRPQAAMLEKVAPPPLAVPAFESLKRFDVSGGLDAPAPAHMEQIFRGDVATGWHQSLSSLGVADAERYLREYWRADTTWVEPKSVAFDYDDDRRIMRLTMEGLASPEWIRKDGLRALDITDSNLGFKAAFAREPGPHADAPFAVPYPAYDKRVVEVILPHGADFRLTGGDADVDQVIGARRYRRDTRIDGDVMTMVAEDRSLASEFPASEAATASAALRALVRFDVFLVSPDSGEPAAAAPAREGTGAPPPPSADAGIFAGQGAAAYAARDFDRAIAAFTQAARLAPLASGPIYDRGAAHFEKAEDALALADFDQALRLNPRDVNALLARADLALIRGDRPGADKDFEAALAIAPGDARTLERRANAYDRAGLFEAAAHGFDAVTPPSPNTGVLASLLNARCWTRAEWGRELDIALALCSRALDLKPEAADILDSRGLVRLRLGQIVQSIDDFDEALRLRPDQASSLFGRGLARLRAGQTARGLADLAAARAASPGIDARFARYGLAPPPGAGPERGGARDGTP
jgi:tetratricopeptide (TPR) repeat protein